LECSYYCNTFDDPNNNTQKLTSGQVC
jgi:hypothetical protein